MPVPCPADRLPRKARRGDRRGLFEERTPVTSIEGRIFRGICRTIQAQIANGTLKPCDRLLPERELAESYGDDFVWRFRPAYQPARDIHGNPLRLDCPTLAHLERPFDAMRFSDKGYRLPQLRPTDYWRRNCGVGAQSARMK